jgi:pyrroloquinoline quinone (PQQ) biosynthesis protein C
VEKSRLGNIGIKRQNSFLDHKQSIEFRAKIDVFIAQKLEEWYQKVPFANHLESGAVSKPYYRRHLIETVLRIRMNRMAQSDAISAMCRVSPEAAQIWAQYQMEEMLHDELFANDAEKIGVSVDEVVATEPFFSTKLLEGFYYYINKHEKIIGVPCYSYLVEHVNVALDPKRLESLSKSFGNAAIKGAKSHAHTDVQDDHPGEVWAVIWRLIRCEEDMQDVYKYIEEFLSLLGMYYRELYEVTLPANTNHPASKRLEVSA